MTDSKSSPERLLLVEGVDDEHVVTHLCRQSGLPVDFIVKQKNGIDNLLQSVPLEVEVPGRQVLGIVADANDKRLDRWTAIRRRFPGETIRSGWRRGGRRACLRWPE